MELYESAMVQESITVVLTCIVEYSTYYYIFGSIAFLVTIGLGL